MSEHSADTSTAAKVANTSANMSLCGKICRWMSWSAGTGTFIFEYATVVWVCTYYWNGFGVYFTLSVACLVLSLMATAATSLLWLRNLDVLQDRNHETQRGRKKLTVASTFSHFLSMGFVYRYITLIHLSATDDVETNIFEADTILVRFLHVILCSAPQVSLHLSFVVAHPSNHGADVAAVTIAAGVLSLVYGLSTFTGADCLKVRNHWQTPLAHHSSLLPSPSPHKLIPLSHMVLVLWHICMLVSRVLVFSLFSSVYGAIVLVVMAAHWGLMFGMLVVTRAICYLQQPASRMSVHRWCAELPFDGMASFGYVFIFFTLRHHLVCSTVSTIHLVTFYLLSWLENTVMVTLFFMKREAVWYAAGSLPLVIGLPLMGLLLYLVYHFVLNPSFGACGRNLSISIHGCDLSLSTFGHSSNSSEMCGTNQSLQSDAVRGVAEDLSNLEPCDSAATIPHPPEPSNPAHSTQSALPSNTLEQSWQNAVHKSIADQMEVTEMPDLVMRLPTRGKVGWGRGREGWGRCGIGVPLLKCELQPQSYDNTSCSTPLNTNNMTANKGSFKRTELCRLLNVHKTERLSSWSSKPVHNEAPMAMEPSGRPNGFSQCCDNIRSASRHHSLSQDPSPSPHTRASLPQDPMGPLSPHTRASLPQDPMGPPSPHYRAITTTKALCSGHFLSTPQRAHNINGLPAAYNVHSTFLPRHSGVFPQQFLPHHSVPQHSVSLPQPQPKMQREQSHSSNNSSNTPHCRAHGKVQRTPNGVKRAPSAHFDYPVSAEVICSTPLSGGRSLRGERRSALPSRASSHRSTGGMHSEGIKDSVTTPLAQAPKSLSRHHFGIGIPNYSTDLGAAPLPFHRALLYPSVTGSSLQTALVTPPTLDVDLPLWLESAPPCFVFKTPARNASTSEV